MSPLRSLTAVMALGTVLLFSGCAADEGRLSSSTDAGRAPWPETSAFDYQLGGPYEPASTVGIVARDRTAPPAPGTYSICYVNAFQTQPGERESWPESVLLTDDGELVHDPDWPDEVLLDTSSAERRTAIVDVVSPWLRGCAEDGFDAVEFDNLDSFTRSDDALTLEDNLELARLLADVAHDAGLAVGQKNTAEHAARLHAEAGFDFAVTEECAAYAECSAYRDVYGAAVLDIEYTDELPRTFEEMCADPDSPPLMILRDRDLRTPASDAYVFETCPSR